jgi:hypothetical protein
MSAPRSADGIAPNHRINLPRQRKNLRLEMRLNVYKALCELAEDGKPLVAVVEELVLRAARPTK